MRCASLERWFMLFLAVGFMVLAGCPSSTRPTVPQTDSNGAKGENLKENAEAVAELKKRGATLATDTDGHVVGVELDRDSGKDADLAYLKELPYVRTLGATEVHGVTDAGLAMLAGHPNLRAIKLERSGVTDAGMPHLQKIPKLEDLDVRRLGITVAGYKEIGKIAGLKRLRVVYNSLNFTDDCLRAIKDLKNLELLDMQDCNLPSEKGLVVLQGFPKLRNVRMYGPNVSDKVLSYLSGAKDLRVLSLEQCSSISEDGLDQIKSLPNLTELSLYGASGIKDTAVAKVAEIKKLEKLDLRSTAISSLALSYLKGLKNLKALDLSEDAVGNEGLEHIQGLTNLEDLNLWSCTINDDGLAHLKGLTKLKRLNLDKCDIADDGLKHLEPLKNLEYLHIGSTQVTDAGLEHLYGLKKLNHLVVTYLPGVSRSGVEKLRDQLPKLDEVEQ